MKRSKGLRRVKVSADGRGVVSHAGVGLLREVAEYTGLVDGVTDVLLDTYDGVPGHPPGRVFTDLAVAVADGADAISGIAVLADRQDLFGPVASMPTTWRVLDRVDAEHLPLLRAARADARAEAWAAGASPDLAQELRLDFDATITIAHSEKENAAATWKRTFGFHPLLCFLDRPEIASGEALAGLLRRRERRVEHRRRSHRRAGHGVGRAAAGGPPAPGRPVRSAAVGPLGLGRGHPRVRRGVPGPGGGVLLRVPGRSSDPTHRQRDSRRVLAPGAGSRRRLREGAWVAEATGMIDLQDWPGGSRLILRKERPHPGAQLSFTDVDGHRITAILTDTPTGVVRGQVAGLELRHRQHARVEDRIRQAKATGLRNLPCRAFNENAAWLETVLTALDLICWTKLIGFADTPELARCEIAAFRYRVLHVAARLTTSGRRLHLRIDATWRWASHIAKAFHRIRAAFA